MSMCMHVCIYGYVYMHMYVLGTYICMCIHTHIKHMQGYIQVCMYALKYTKYANIHIDPHVYFCNMCLLTHICHVNQPTYMYTSMHT